MVPMSEKRHRLYHYEIPEIIDGLFLRLDKLTKERKEEEKATIAFHTLYRLLFAKTSGRPNYPEFSRSSVIEFIEVYKGTSDD